MFSLFVCMRVVQCKYDNILHGSFLFPSSRGLLPNNIVTAAELLLCLTTIRWEDTTNHNRERARHTHAPNTEVYLRLLVLVGNIKHCSHICLINGLLPQQQKDLLLSIYGLPID